MLMAKKTNELPHPQNALNKFMVRIIFERNRLTDAFSLDGNTAYPATTMTPKHLISAEPCEDNAGRLVESYLEDMYHSLYGEPLELRKLLIDAKGESVKAGVEFKLTLNPLLNAMFQVHESCIEGLRTGNGWNTEAHCKAFEELFQELGTYSERINQIVANTDDKPMVESVGETMPKVVMGRVKKKLRSKRLQGKKLESDISFSSAITDHHQYEKGSKKSGASCLNFEPISCEELGSKAKLGINSASKFIRKWLGTYKNYAAHCRDKTLIVDLQLLNNEATSRFNINLDVEKIGGYDPEPDFPL
jgi:hypothetical protein